VLAVQGAETALPKAPVARRQGRIRVRTIVLALVVLLLIALVVGSFVVSRSYGPVESRGGMSGPASADAGRMVWDLPLGSRGVESMVVDGRKDGSFQFFFEVTNTGRIPLTFSAFEDDPIVVARISDARISTKSVEEAGGKPKQYLPLDGARLEPGQRRTLEVTATWRAICDGGLGEGSTTSLSGFPLRYGYGPFES
jgi:hypothetical protein